MHSILLAEDNPDVRFMISEVLHTHIDDCVVVTAKDGLETVRLAKKQYPDVVLLDIQMPVMDGFEVCRILKDDPEMRHIPIVFLTATYDDLKSKIKGMELGADDYITQPVDNLELVTRVKVMLRIKSLYDELRRAGQKLQRAKQQKFAFLSHISHELRSPLNGVLGFAELLANEYYGPLNSNQHGFLSMIDKGGRQLLTLVDDISLLARLKTGGVTLHPETLSLTRLIDTVWIDLQNMADNKRISFRREVPPELDRITADKKGLETILRNLFDNAITYNQVGGQINLNCRLQQDQSVAITITDTGQGIKPEDKDKIFTPFPKIARKEGGEQGSGLGLAICKKFVELMGGSIEFESAPGAGSTFTVYLPFAETISHQPSAVSLTSPVLKTILAFSLMYCLP
ncbi:MAG: hybrid sensor histidine kinase/response regulator [Thermodesulfobacteriota bacterium]|nr:hybrid sensor histidine kinase/response regulator [Thermodesulfobacteriota bacterium]